MMLLQVEEEEDGLSSAYDYKLLNAWLSHPVKRFKGSIYLLNNFANFYLKKQGPVWHNIDQFWSGYFLCIFIP